MLEQIKLLTSRRAYEFRPDDLRLSILSVKPVQEQIQGLFQFQTAIMATPMPTFGEVPATYPPGFVFDMGVWISPGKQPVPIRFLHFEQRRIVIDVAGKSSDIAAVFNQLCQFLAQLKSSDGSPVIGEPERVLDYSEITAHFSFSLEALLAPPLRRLFVNIEEQVNRKECIQVPAVVIQMHSQGQEFGGMITSNDTRSTHSFIFTQRAGTRFEEQIYFSGAPLDSETHLAYLDKLETALSS